MKAGTKRNSIKGLIEFYLERKKEYPWVTIRDIVTLRGVLNKEQVIKAINDKNYQCPVRQRIGLKEKRY